MKKFFEMAGGISALLAIVAAGISFAWFIFSLSGRVDTLEHQMQALYQSSSTAQPNETGSKTGIARDESIPTTSIVRTCSELAIRAADAYRNGSPLSVAQPLEQMMDKLGCNKLAR
jgi:hypothetical protein